MIRKISAASLTFAAILTVSSSLNAAQLNITDLPQDRTSIEYEAKINALLHVLEGNKWENQKGVGLTFRHNSEITSSWKGDRKIEDGIFVDVEVFYFGKPYTKYLGYAQQSKIDGYVEIFNWDSRDTQNHIKVIDGKTLSVYYHASAQEREQIYKKVDTLNTDSPKPLTKQISTEDGGAFF